MAGFDWVIAIIALASVLVGIKRGFIKEALSITSWIVSIWLAITFCHQAGDFIASYVSIPADAFRVSAGFALIFVVALFVFSAISAVVTKFLVKSPIRAADRALGVIFGAIRAGAIVVAIMLVARGLGMQNSDWWQNSTYLPRFLPVANYIEPLLPNQLQSSLQDPLDDEASLEQQAIKQALENIQLGDANDSINDIINQRKQVQ